MISMQPIIDALAQRKKTIFILFLLFLLAFGIRAHQFKFDLIFGFDSYYHARLVGYILQNGTLPANDPLAYYQLGGAPLPATGTFFWYFNALIYTIFTLGTGYNKDTLIFFVKLMPAIYGALTAVLMYFIGRKLYGKKAGYAMAFFAAVVPAYVYRTMAGFFEEDSFGFIWMISGFILFFMATKVPRVTKRKVGYAVLAGALFGVMAFAWNLFILIPILLVLYLPFAVLNIYAKQGTRQATDFAKLWGVTFAVFFALASASDGGNWIKIAVNYVVGVIPAGVPLYLIGIAGVLIVMALYILLITGKKAGAESNKKTILFIGIASLYVVLIIMISIFWLVPDYRGAGVLENSVGEENTGKLSFPSKYNALIILPVLALLLLPFRAYRQKDEHYSVLLFFWIVVTLFMAWYKLKFTYTFGLPIALAGGVVTAELFYFFSGKKDTSTKIVSLALAFMFLIGVGAAAKFVTTQPPSIETNPGWKEALTWVSRNTPEDARFFNWWDQGHWLTFVGERNAFLDNRNFDYVGDQNFAQFLIDLNLEKSMAIIRHYQPDYLLLSYDMPGKIISYATYAYNTRNFDDPEIRKFFVGSTNSIRCRTETNGSTIIYVCGGNRIAKQEMEKLPTTWQKIPNQVLDNRTPLYIYREADNSVLHGINAMVNQTTMVKIYFNHPETRQYFDEVYSAQGIKIFKVKKQV